VAHPLTPSLLSRAVEIIRLVLALSASPYFLPFLFPRPLPFRPLPTHLKLTQSSLFPLLLVLSDHRLPVPVPAAWRSPSPVASLFPSNVASPPSCLKPPWLIFKRVFVPALSLFIPGPVGALCPTPNTPKLHFPFIIDGHPPLVTFTRLRVSHWRLRIPFHTPVPQPPPFFVYSL